MRQTFDLERQQARTDAGEPFWIYSRERAVVDALRLPGSSAVMWVCTRCAATWARPARARRVSPSLPASSVGRLRLRPALEALLS